MKLTSAIVILITAISAHAQLIDIAPDPFLPPDRHYPPQRHFNWAVESRFVDMQVRNQVASVTLTETLLNTCGRTFEAEYYLPIPAQAGVDQLTLTVNGEEMSGEILSAEDARRRYEDIVRRRRDPALLEYAGLGCIRVSAFPLEPNKPATLTIHYTMLCPRDGDVVELQFPLASARHSSAPVKEIRVTADIQGQTELKNIYSPTVEIDTDYRSDTRASVTYEARNSYPMSDFVVYYSEDQTEVGATFLTYFPDRSKDGYYMMLVSPGRKAISRVPLAKDILLVLDRSGSMSGEKIMQAREAARFVVNNLNSNDRFDVLTYSNSVESSFGTLTSATRANINTALADIDRVEANGGTNIHGALAEAMEILERSARQASLGDTPHRPAYVFFMTDGLPTVGVTDEQKIIDDTDAANALNARLFCFGVGYDVNVRLLDNIANNQGGKSAYVNPNEDIEDKVSSLYSKIRNPVMTNIEAIVDGFRLRDREPDELRDLFENDQIVQVGRISNSGQGLCETDLVVTGTFQGEEHEFTYPVTINTSNHRSSYKFIEKLWAQRRVAFLLNEVRLKGNVAELVDEITELATRYGIVTPYTSYLADENQNLADVGSARRIFSEQALVAHEDIVGAAPQMESQALEFRIAAKSPAMSLDASGSLKARTDRSAMATEEETISTMRVIGGEIFYKRGDYWILSSLTNIDLQNDLSKYTHISRFSDEYFSLLAQATHDENALLSGQREGEKFLVAIQGQTYVVE